MPPDAGRRDAPLHQRQPLAAVGGAVTSADVTRLIAGLSHVPRGRRVVVIIVDNADDQGELTPIEGSTTTVVATPAPAAAVTPGGQRSPLQIAQQMKEQTPGVRLTPAQWTARFDGAVPERELHRAVAFGAVAAAPRGKGRGHGAVVISPNDMVTYLELLEDGRRSREGRPHWFNDVVKGGRRGA